MPISPFIFLTASLTLKPFVLSPSIFKILSPGSNPARKAGVPSRGLMTSSGPFSEVTNDSDAAKLRLDTRLETIEILRRNVIGVGIELANHAVDGSFHQLAITHLGHVVLLDLRERIGEQRQQFEFFLVVDLLIRAACFSLVVSTDILGLQWRDADCQNKQGRGGEL